MILLPACILCGAGQLQTTDQEPIQRPLCQIIREPDNYNGKLVQFRASIESGQEDLPSGVADDSCAADVPFFSPDDKQLDRLLKDKEFRKLLKEVKRNPFVDATVTGWFLSGASAKPRPGQRPGPKLILESVSNVKVRKLNLRGSGKS
ncbi:MAG: hypothetical protein U0Q18_14985 [Bryobacteraceae bacterium]